MLRFSRLLSVLTYCFLLILLSCGDEIDEFAQLPGVNGPQKESPPLAIFPVDTDNESKESSAWLAFLISNQMDDFTLLPDTMGPMEESPGLDFIPADLNAYSEASSSRMAVLITDEDSSWIGLVHGFKSFGIPFRLTDSIQTALDHDTVLIYPGPKKQNITEEEVRQLESYVRSGGTLISSKLNSKLLFPMSGVDDLKNGRDHFELEYSPGYYSTGFTYPEEWEIRIGNPERRRTRPRVQEFSGIAEVLARYEDGSAAIIRNANGNGRVITFGFDVGHYIKEAQNNRDEEASRSYVNDFEPSVDTVIRYIENIYREHESNAAILHSAPDGFPLSVIISHDVDYAGSLENSLDYARLERKWDYGATYFMQTKYFQDFFDVTFFDDKTDILLAELEDLDMEIASHSVSHSDMFARLPQGSFDESYPEYQPRIIEFSYTDEATIMGELRVSKFLLEHFSNSTIESFRPGFLAYPFSLPESLESADYKYSSAVTANDVLSHMPFRQTFNRLYEGETSIYEFPITVEDEKPPHMDERVEESIELAHKIASYGGIYMVLIHPDVLDHKYRWLEQVTPRLRDWAWWGTLKEFGNWWSARDGIEWDIFDSANSGGEKILRIHSDEYVSGIAFELPHDYVPGEQSNGKMINGFYVFDLPSGETEILLRPVDLP